MTDEQPESMMNKGMKQVVMDMHHSTFIWNWKEEKGEVWYEVVQRGAIASKQWCRLRDIKRPYTAEIIAFLAVRAHTMSVE